MDRLIDIETGDVLISHLEVANTFWRRFKGLQLRRSLPSGAGIWLSPCSSLHTCFMRFPIDVIMLDRELSVVGLRKQIPPWNAVICVKHTTSVIEIAATTKSWTVGQKLKILSGVGDRHCDI